MRRRALLAVVGAATTAGCLADTGGLSRGSPTPAVDVPPCPEIPSTLTKENVETYTAEFERAYVVRQVLDERDDVTYVSFLDEPNPSVVEQDGDGYVLHLEAFYGYGFRQHPTAEDTAHYDSGTYRASYYVDSRTTMRATDHETYPDPRTDGSVVDC